MNKPNIIPSGQNENGAEIEYTPWIGLDLDGTLAHYDGWRGHTHIGEPVEHMANQLKKWVEDGENVKIMTARISPKSCEANGEHRDAVIERIDDWMLHNFGFTLPITHEKDYQMTALYDDRCIQIIPNTGRRADGRD